MVRPPEQIARCVLTPEIPLPELEELKALARAYLEAQDARKQLWCFFSVLEATAKLWILLEPPKDLCLQEQVKAAIEVLKLADQAEDLL